MANASLMTIPDEYVDNGSSIKIPSSAKSIIIGSFSSTSSFVIPNNNPFIAIFCRPVNSGLKPVPNSSRPVIRPLTWISPSSGNKIPVIILSNVDLPAPLGPTIPNVSPPDT